MTGSKCWVHNCFHCRSFDIKHGIVRSYFSFPKNLYLRKKWIKACKQDVDLITGRVCSDHFKHDDYSLKTDKSRVKRLKPNAVPSLLIGTVKSQKKNVNLKYNSGERNRKLVTYSESNKSQKEGKRKSFIFTSDKKNAKEPIQKKNSLKKDITAIINAESLSIETAEKRKQRTTINSNNKNLKEFTRNRKSQMGDIKKSEDPIVEDNKIDSDNEASKDKLKLFKENINNMSVANDNELNRTVDGFTKKSEPSDSNVNIDEDTDNVIGCSTSNVTRNSAENEIEKIDPKQSLEKEILIETNCYCSDGVNGELSEGNSETRNKTNKRKIGPLNKVGPRRFLKKRIRLGKNDSEDSDSDSSFNRKLPFPKENSKVNAIKQKITYQTPSEMAKNVDLINYLNYLKDNSFGQLEQPILFWVDN